MKKFILTTMLISLIAAPLKTQAMESLTVGVTNNATLAASAGLLGGLVGTLWFTFKEIKAFEELIVGKEINIDILNQKHEISSKRISTGKGILNILKNTTGSIACFAIYAKCFYYLREHVFNKKIDPNALSPIDSACLWTLYPALFVGIPALFSAIQDTDAAYNKTYDDIDGYKVMYLEQANQEFKVFTGATGMVLLSLLIKAVADKALNISAEKVVA